MLYTTTCTTHNHNKPQPHTCTDNHTQLYGQTEPHIHTPTHKHTCTITCTRTTEICHKQPSRKAPRVEGQLSTPAELPLLSCRPSHWEAASLMAVSTGVAALDKWPQQLWKVYLPTSIAPWKTGMTAFLTGQAEGTF